MQRIGNDNQTAAAVSLFFDKTYRNNGKRMGKQCSQYIVEVVS